MVEEAPPTYWDHTLKHEGSSFLTGFCLVSDWSHSDQSDQATGVCSGASRPVGDGAAGEVALIF